MPKSTKDLASRIEAFMRVACEVLVPTLPPGSDGTPRSGFMVRYVSGKTRKEIMVKAATSPQLLKLIDANSRKSTYVQATGWGDNTLVKILCTAANAGHISSFLTRNEADGFWNGCVLVVDGDGIIHCLAISGLPEMHDESVVLCCLVAVGLTNTEGVREVISISSNKTLPSVVTLLTESNEFDAEDYTNLINLDLAA